MRSRYTAYVLQDADYLLASWHPSTRPTGIDLNPQQKWLGLKIRDVVEGETESYVEFVARFKIAGRGHRLVERSRFVKEDGIWYYVDGIMKN